MRLPAVLILLCTIAFPTSAATPFWGAKASDAVDVAPPDLELGHFVWLPQAAPAGPIVVVVGLDDQIAYAYRNGVRIGYAKVSTGKKGHETPTGVFTTLQKDKDHHSSIYNNAAMPYTQRLTWGGVALHAGGIPDYPSSHGCVHLPSEFARLLFEVSPMGMTVVVGDEAVVPADVAHPAMLEPVDPNTGAALETPRLAAHETSRWQPDLSPEGPVAMLLSSADPDDPKTRMLEKIEQQTFRAAKIVNGLLNLARPQSGDMGPVDVNTTINDPSLLGMTLRYSGSLINSKKARRDG